MENKVHLGSYENFSANISLDGCYKHEGIRINYQIIFLNSVGLCLLITFAL